MAAIVPVVRRIIVVVTGIFEGTHEFFFASSTLVSGREGTCMLRSAKRRRMLRPGVDHISFCSAKIYARGESKLSKGVTFGSS